MDKEKIIAELQKHDSTILSFPDRGPWGDNKYRGNCSGWIQAFLIWKYGIQKFAELFAGSGTGYDVCKDMGIDYIGADLNPNPVRANILTVNAVTDEVPQEFYGADMLFMHPPYGAEIRIPYAGKMYHDPTGELSKFDLGQMQWETFIKVLNKIIMNYYSALKNGAYMSVLMGDVRRNGLHSMFADIVKPGQLEQVIIKTQHNCVSNSRVYSARNFVPIEHEYIMVLKKIMPYIIQFQLPQKFETDIRDSKQATWASVVYAVIEKNGGSITLTHLYEELQNHKKAKANPHWKEKIRQTLQIYDMFVSDSHSRGVWKLA